MTKKRHRKGEMIILVGHFKNEKKKKQTNKTKSKGVKDNLRKNKNI